MDSPESCGIFDSHYLDSPESSEILSANPNHNLM